MSLMKGVHKKSPPDVPDRSVAEVLLDKKGRVITTTQDSDGNEASVTDASATLDETLVEYLRTVAALYGWDGTDLRRLAVDPTEGHLRVGFETLEAIGDGEASNALGVRNPNGGVNPFNVGALGLLYDGSTFNRHRNNVENTVLASTQVSNNRTSSEFTNHNAPGGVFLLNISSLGGATPAINNFKIQGKDPVSGNFYDVLKDASGISTTGIFPYVVHPGASATGGQYQGVEGTALPRTWRVFANVDTADGDETYTFSVGMSYVL